MKGKQNIFRSRLLSFLSFVIEAITNSGRTCPKWRIDNSFLRDLIKYNVELSGDPGIIFKRHAPCLEFLSLASDQNFYQYQKYKAYLPCCECL
ncbi:hypothetical protein Pla144_46130 [Bythopirellula polymerisocia]|uniref:Uncharacterized protein n=1 Tax=Bythopirellula polymerisocia TaxID=2528003 RepID=A0A5C6CBC6_9BACT|nr:hypothetical protein Pla144_46130 [Bythopirellula polymerisocia]